MLDICWNFADITRMEFEGHLPPFLIIASASRHQQNLAADMFVPVIAAARLKGNVADGQSLVEWRQHVEPNRPFEILTLKFPSNGKNYTLA